LPFLYHDDIFLFVIFHFDISASQLLAEEGNIPVQANATLVGGDNPHLPA
jgi:hypothetical protein